MGDSVFSGRLFILLKPEHGVGMNEDLEHLLITPVEMAAIDKAAAASGIDSFGLMTSAGYAVAASALRHFPGARRFAVFCGPGNNGGDGYVAAKALEESGAAVSVYASAPGETPKGDAAIARTLCRGEIRPLSLFEAEEGDVVIDALFGAGLSRGLSGSIAAAAGVVKAAGLPVLAVDLPSGLSGLSGDVLGAAFEAARTVTFMCRKPGHVLMPGRRLCGPVEVIDIGIPARIVLQHAGRLHENSPRLWQSTVALPDTNTHKFKRGHLAVFSGGPARTGAARLSAMAGLRTGAGLVTIASPSAAMAENAAHLTAIMLREVANTAALAAWLKDPRLTAFILGPAFGTGQKAREFAGLLKDRPAVLDADGLSSFKDGPGELFDLLSAASVRWILTPHVGEFARLFPAIAADHTLSKVEKAQTAARRANAVVIYKGPDTVIAAPDGRAAINTNAPPWLATAGSGDVLAGIAGGLLAQGVPAFESAAAAVWIHGEAARRAGPGLVAEDLSAHIAASEQAALAQHAGA